ncbi:MAG: hypothetical protein O9330_13200 [Beijerinckiaceae bacterium]|jgi:hypothetical protein|nr:hypothetical protein [Beijerinckiaceae bacterium]
MSDIAIRFDGLLLLIAMAASSGIYGVVAIVSLAMAIRHRGRAPRASRIARAAGMFAIATLVAFGVLFVYWADSGTGKAGLNWPDLLVFPWLVLFAAGCWRLLRI